MSLRHLYSAPPLGVASILLKFRQDLWRQKSRVPGLSQGVVCVILCLAVLMVDRQTGKQCQYSLYRPTALA